MPETTRVLPKAYLRLDPNIDQTHPDPGAMVRLMCAAARQPERGHFRSRAVLENVLGRADARRCIDRGDVTAEPDGRWYVEGWREWQEGDLTVAERQARIRYRRANGVTPPLSGRDSAVTPGVIEPLPAPLLLPLRTPTTTSETVDSRRKTKEVSSTTPTAVPTRANGESSRTMSKEEYARFEEEWSSFTDPIWAPFKAAWTGRGLFRPPSGDPDNDAGTSQRSRLYAIADARPTDIARWIREAPGNTARDVVGYIFDKWGAIADEVGVTEEAVVEIQRKRRLEPVGNIIGKMQGDA